MKYPCYKGTTIKDCDGYDHGCQAAWSTCIYGNQNTTRKALQQNWKIFIGGHWQKEMPTKPGTYPVASRDGYHAGNRVVTIINDQACDVENIGNSDTIEQWGGWWWSEPVPKMPKAPQWDDNA